MIAVYQQSCRRTEYKYACLGAHCLYLRVNTGTFRLKSVKKRLILDTPLLEAMLARLCMQLCENHGNFAETVLLGMQPRGSHAARRICEHLTSLTGSKVPLGFLDATFYRDDFRRRNTPLQPNATEVPFLLEGKKVVLVDDVLFTGRSVRAALDAMLAFGRPDLVELLVLIDRRYTREFPIQPDYTGMQVDSVQSQHVLVEWQQPGTDTPSDAIWLMS